jgi:hypothetical protein
MRPQIRELKPELSWSLSLLASHYPPDNTGYWILCFKAHDIYTKIARAYPAENWDTSSMQMQVGSIPREYFSVGKFRFIDAIFMVSIATHPESPYGLEYGTLLVGRQADHRRMSPQPWCRFLDHPVDFSRAAEIVSSYQRRPITQDPEENSSLMTYYKHSIRASVKAKEISGVFFYVVSIIPTEKGKESVNTEMLLGNDIFYGRKVDNTGVHIRGF